MKMNLSTGSQTKSVVVTKEKKYKEDENNKNGDTENQTHLDRKLGVKSIRKILRTLCSDNFPKEEMDLMIWVCITVFIIYIGSRWKSRWFRW